MRTVYFRLYFLIPLFFGLTLGCASAQRQKTAAQPPSQVKSGAKVPVQAQAEEAAIASLLNSVRTKGTDYRISPADLLKITVYREDDLNREVRVSQQGTISFPLVGALRVGGMSVIEAEKALSERLSEYLRSPQLTVFVKEYGNKHVYILGEVKKPGSYELPTESQLTVLEAISLAGGFSDVAAKDRTRVIRTAADGKSVNLTIQVTDITSHGKKDKDIPLEPNDVVYVPQSFF